MLKIYNYLTADEIVYNLILNAREKRMDEVKRGATGMWNRRDESRLYLYSAGIISFFFLRKEDFSLRTQNMLMTKSSATNLEET